MFKKFFSLSTITLFKKQIPISLLLLLFVIVPRLALWSVALYQHSNLALASPEDSSSYIRTGTNLFTHGVFSFEMPPHLAPDSFRTPVYPVILYIISLEDHHLSLASIVQYAFVYLDAIVLFHLARQVFKNSTTALLASSLFALEPYFIFWSGLAMSETVFATFLILMVWYAYKVIEMSRKKDIIACGIFFGLAAMTRPILAPFFVPTLVLFITLLVFQKNNIRILIKKVMLLSLGFLLVVFPWSLRNYVNFKSWNISSVGSFNALFYDSALVLSRSQHRDWNEVIAYLENRMGYPGVELITFTSLKYEPQLLHTAYDIFREHPGAFLKVRAQNIVAFLLNDGYLHIGRVFGVSVPNSIQIAGKGFWILNYLAISFLFYAHTTQLRPKATKNFALFIALIIAYFAIVTGAVASARYRIPAMPFIFLLSSAGLVHGWKIVQQNLFYRVDRESSHPTSKRRIM